MNGDTEEIKNKKDVLKTNIESHLDTPANAILLREIGLFYDGLANHVEAIKYHCESVKMLKRIHKGESDSEECELGLIYLADSINRIDQATIIDFCH